MRFDELKLQAWGHFTDVTVDLSGGSHGLHVLYGANEAGKSTTLRAFRAVLFGVPHITSDAHHHDQRALRIGATVQLSDGRELTFVRRKGNKNTLLSPTGSSLDGARLQPFVGGLSADGFANSFAIGHAELRAGGRALAQGRGDVGESLFAASLGGAGLRKVLEELEQEADALFRPQGRLQTVNKAIGAFNGARKRVREATLTGAKWRRHQAAFETAEADRVTTSEALDATRRERERLLRLGRCVPLVPKLQELRRKRSTLGEVPALRPDAAEARRRTEQGLESARRNARRATELAETAAADLAKLEVPDALLAAGAPIEELHQRLGSIRKAAADRQKLASRESALRLDATAALADAVPDATLEELDDRRPAAAPRRRLKGLIASASGVREGVRLARKELAHRRKAVGESPAEVPEDLASAVRRARASGDLEREEQKAGTRSEARELELRAAASRLDLGSDDVETLAARPLPTRATIEALAGTAEEVRRRRTRCEEQVRKVSDDRERVEAALIQLERGGSVPTEDELTEVRRTRDTDWAALRERWATGQNFEDVPADAFAASIAAADRVADTLRNHAEQSARKATLLEQREALESLRQRVEKEREQVEDAEKAWALEWADAWARAGRTPARAEDGRTLLDGHESLVAGWRELLELRAETASALAAVGRVRSELGTALDVIGEPAPSEQETLAALLDRCERRARRGEAESTRHATAARELKEAEEAFAEAEAELARWNEAWAAALAPLGLQPDAEAEEVEAVLDLLDLAVAHRKEADSLADRVAKIDADAKHFAADVTALGLAEPGEAPTATTVALHGKLQAAREAGSRRDELMRKQEEQRVIVEDSDREVEQFLHDLATLCREARVDDPNELPAVEAAFIEASTLSAGIEESEERLLAESAGSTLEQLIRDVEALDADALPGQIDALDREVAEHEAALGHLAEQIGSERTVLTTMDGSATAADAEEEAAQALAEVRAGAERYVRVRLAHGILKRAIEGYRREHQEPLLLRAGKYFSRLTLGAFAGLGTDYDAKDEAVLVGVRQVEGEVDGKRLRVDAMSDGTRDQLYLALRLAAVESHADASEPLPLLVDDVLVHFDDDRALAALGCLAELATTTQVVLLTHHTRIVELSRSLAPPAEVFVRTLESSGEPA